MPKSVLIYVRVSYSKQVEGTSLEMQDVSPLV